VSEPKLSEPVLPGDAPSDYERYLNTEALLALQKGPDEWVHRDELLFQTVHQASELWLKLAAAEAAEATALIESSDLAGALRLLRRSAHCLVIVTGALDMLGHPREYQEVRSRPLAASTRPASRRSTTCCRTRAFRRARAGRRPELIDVYVHGRARGAVRPAEALIGSTSGLVWRVRHFVVVERVIGGAASVRRAHRSRCSGG
jgi:tryptophan 2,3-dioxygenase